MMELESGSQEHLQGFHCVQHSKLARRERDSEEDRHHTRLLQRCHGLYVDVIASNWSPEHPQLTLDSHLPARLLSPDVPAAQVPRHCRRLRYGPCGPCAPSIIVQSYEIYTLNGGESEFAPKLIQ